MSNPNAKRYTAEEMEVRAHILDKAYEMPVAAAMMRQGIRTESDVQALVEALKSIRDNASTGTFPGNGRIRDLRMILTTAEQALSNLDAKERGV